jgi:hypothetical protein
LAGPLAQLAGSSGWFGGGGADGKGSFGAAGDILGKIFGGGGDGLSGGDIEGAQGGGGGFLSRLGGLGGIGKTLGKAGASYGAGELAANVLGRGTMAGRAASAAGKGAAIGSVIPGVGTVIGGAVGAAIPYAKKAGKWLKKRFSDEDLKDDFVPVGSGLFEYRWKGTDRREVGVIAQDVQRVMPSAVSRDKSGYLKVDYSKAPTFLKQLASMERA